GYALEELYPDRIAEHCEELAHHFSQGEERAKAFDYLVQSGDRARDANASPVALELYARALEAPRHVPALPPTRRPGVAQRRCPRVTSTQRLGEAHAEAGQMLALAREAGDRRLEGEAMADIAYAHYMSFNWDQVEPLKPNVEQASVIAREIGDD